MRKRTKRDMKSKQGKRKGEEELKEKEREEREIKERRERGMGKIYRREKEREKAGEREIVGFHFKRQLRLKRHRNEKSRRW